MKKIAHIVCALTPKTFFPRLLFFAVFLSLSGLFVPGCKKDNLPAGPSTDAFETLAKSFLTKATLPLSLDALTLGAEVPQDSLENMARQVIEEMVFLQTDPAGNLLVNKVRDGLLPKVTIDNMVAGFLADGRMLKGDYLVRFQWRTNTGVAFTTLGAVSPGGVPRFEPVLHFNGIETVHTPGVQPRSGWTSTWTRTIENGFGSDCVEVEWKVDITTSPDGCNIVDPAPHIEITKQLSNCWGWEQHTTKGEIAWCNPQQDCRCSVQPQSYGEDCIKWVVVTYVATGASNIKVETNAGGEYKGFKVDAKVSFEVSRFGSEATFEKIGNLCAKSGSI
ncbi:MAG: hypothetical protein IPH12_17930 [Saprospirales bacterium]|nr:hypothetical protein [Saprospirales bacterium]